MVRASLARLGPFDPHLADQREFLALGVGRTQRQRARRHAKILPDGDGAKEARALEDRNVVGRLPVLGLQHPEPGIADIRDRRRHLQAAEVEPGRIVAERTGLPVLDEVDHHRG